MSVSFEVLVVLLCDLEETDFFLDSLLHESESVDPWPLFAALAWDVEEFSESDELESVPDDEEELEDDDELLLDDADSELVTLGC